MRLAALCPTFRRPRLIPGIIEMFQRQTYEDKLLLILDDGGSFESQSGNSWKLTSFSDRFKTVWHKFNWLLQQAALHGVDGIVLMEDDDIYLPDYMADHAATLRKSLWSAGERVWFKEQNSPARLEPAKLRFHGGCAYRREAISAINGYGEAPWGSDSDLLVRLKQNFGDAADPWAERPCQYVYRWQMSGYPNAHGYGKNMHEMVALSHAPETYNGQIVPQMDYAQQTHFDEVMQLIEEQSV